ncbi:MAG: cytochrome bd-I ubiquinol oxidase subunit, partial [Thauera sp.]|nr:cytochrome bd-I ubiquinol oxidase subunit [Thauera sp.]
NKENDMWYFAWVLGIGFAVLLAILNALWGENEEARAEALRQARLDAAPADPNGSGAH